MLFPAAVLIVVLLAGLTVDSALTFLAQRELANAAAAAANDAASAISGDAYYGAASYDIDATDAVARGGAALDVRVDDAVRVTDVSVTRLDRTHIRVDVTGEVSLIFSKAIPGVDDTRRVHASAVAEARQR